MIKSELKERYPILSKIVKRYYWIKNQIRYCVYCVLPESMYPFVLSRMYKRYQGKELNWEGELYTEKMQRAKLYDTDVRKTEYSDKYAVRKWVESMVGEEYLIPLLGVWEHAEEINFEKLPNDFVLKTNHASSDVIIVKDKEQLSEKDVIDIRKKMEYALKHSYELVQGFEMQYKNIPPKIIAESLIRDSQGRELRDYKFLCFDGIPYYCWVDCDRYSNHTRNVYDMNWKLMEWTQGNYKNSSVPVEMPANFDVMIKIVKILSKGFSHVRVDLYNIEGKIYFGEMTFSNGSGFEKIPDYVNYELGKLWRLD